LFLLGRTGKEQERRAILFEGCANEVGMLPASFLFLISLPSFRPLLSMRTHFFGLWRGDRANLLKVLLGKIASLMVRLDTVRDRFSQSYVSAIAAT